VQLPARIGKYELEELLGRGMAEVYRARDTVIGRTVAVKVLTDEGCKDSETKNRFLAEARMAGSISHENVISIYDFGVDENQHPFMVMEFLRGEDLRHAIKNGRTGDLSNKLRIALDIARALEYTHSLKIIHRDIKPENVHINQAGVVKLMDFGIAKTEGLGMTRAGYVLGTPYYMAPEQVMGQGITEQVDVYSFGILLFELMTGRKPITGEAVERIFFSILNEPIDLTPLRESGAPESICNLVAACTAKNPAERPQGFGPVCAELQRQITELTAATMVIPTVVVPPPPPRPKWILPAVLGVVVALAVGIYFATRPKVLPATITTPTGDMVLVQSGPFRYGDEAKEPGNLPDFYIDKTEVTNKDYLTFIKATGHDEPVGFQPEKPDYPVVNVTYADAAAYAGWAHKRMPKGTEWEKAARGTDGRLYPWGNQPDKSLVNLGSSSAGPVTGFANGKSPYGALNMVGNVAEYIDQRHPATEFDTKNEAFSKLQPPPTADEPWYRIRGLSFSDPSKYIDRAVWDFVAVPARWKGSNIGFRCVADPDQALALRK